MRLSKSYPHPQQQQPHQQQQQQQQQQPSQFYQPSAPYRLSLFSCMTKLSASLVLSSSTASTVKLWR